VSNDTIAATPRRASQRVRIERQYLVERPTSAICWSHASGSTCSRGNNGQGKTNLLEAIFVVSTPRSLRTAKLDQLVEVLRAERDAAVARVVALELRGERDVHSSWFLPCVRNRTLASIGMVSRVSPSW
jgi:hypothetical protein